MQQNTSKFNISWNLPLNSHDNYWLCVVEAEGEKLKALEKKFPGGKYGGVYIDETCYALTAPQSWKETWDELYEVLLLNNLSHSKAAVIPRQKERPTMDEVRTSLESITKIHSLAKNLWLGDAILDDRVECHFQPITDRANQIFGYEAFARARLPSGELLSGAKIIEAAQEMGIKHLIDKFLHILTIKTFAEAKLQGSLFINFMTGFIQLPAKYLEGLSEAVKHYDLMPKRLVLDVADCENARDIDQISSIINFCSSKGYSVALDDITSLSSLKTMLRRLTTKPDFIKLDRKIVSQCGDPKIQREIYDLTELAHEKGSMILAEGIETNEAYKTLVKNSIDLFQGYFIAPPMPAGELKSVKIKKAN